MTLLGIDHLVIVVRDLAVATRDYAALGFTVTPGGTHADGQTHNALVAFVDGTYLELIAFVRPDQPSTHYWWPRLAEGEGLEDVCLRLNDLAAEAARWRAAGLDAQGPTPGGRTRPDGVALRWQTVRFGQPARDALLPFIIEDETARELRVPGGDAATRHTVMGRDIQGVRGVRVATHDLRAGMRDYSALLGSAPSEQTETSAHFTIGDGWIALHAPAHPGDAIDQHLSIYGAGPYALVLGSGAPAQPPRALTSPQAHGTDIWVE